MNDLKLANPWLRFAGWMVDLLLWAAVWLGAVWWLVTATTVPELLDSLLWAVAGLGLLGILGNLVVTAGFTHWFGGTVGKLVLGMEVVDEPGKRLSFRRAIWREWFGSWVSGMALWLGFIWIFVDKDRRGWHDMMAGTTVVEKRRNGLLIGIIGLVVIIGMIGIMGIKIFERVQKNMPFYRGVMDDTIANIKSSISE